MANTSLAALVPQLLAQGLLALREMAVMPALVNRQYEVLAGPEGSTITVPIPSAGTAVAVSPGPTPPADNDSSPTSVSIALDQWYESFFQLTDKERMEVMAGSIPVIASEKIRALANNVDQYILNLGKQFYGFVGTPATTPFGSGVEIASATQVRKTLNNQLAPLDNRRLVFNADCEANMLGLRAFHDASFGVGAGAILAGEIGPKLGFLNALDQNVRSHTAGTASGATTNTAGYAVGVKTITLAVAGTGTILVGDVITFAGHSQTYVVTAGDADVSNGGTVSFEPGLVVALPTSAVAISVKATHVMNLGFHRDAIALATRPLAGTTHPSSIVESAVDPVSGLALRLEVSRQHKQDRFSFDILYGAAVVRRELGVRLAG